MPPARADRTQSNRPARARSALERIDWRWLAALGALLGLTAGLLGLWASESHWWLAAWVAAFLGIAWLGWDADPRLDGQLVVASAPKALGPRMVRDGPLAMVELPGGEFLMGSPDSDRMAHGNEKPQHPVRVSGFRIARTQVTAGLYREIMGGGREDSEPDLPAASLSWSDAIEFCNRLSRREGYRPCYRRLGLWPLRIWRCNWRADGYRLPTEAEWEYACRAGSRTRYSFGDDPALLDDYAWYSENSGQRTHPVATKRPNAWGIFDMHGNVWEWCWDRYGPYRARPQTDPRGPIIVRGRWRVLRGGSFWGQPEDLRAAGRFGGPPEVRDANIGFRCVRVASPQH
jgi:formylglycine-generating enzyme required for sulfatase activity